MIAYGDWFVIECAVRLDFSSPVAEYLDGLSEGSVEGELLPDEQVQWSDWFYAACRRIAEKGTPPHRDAHNQLSDGIWELKHWDLRISFYDTDGSGVYTPTIDRESYSRFTTRPWPDDFEERLRLTTTFPKTGQNAEPAQIALAIKVREEDLEHDRTA